MKNLTLIYSLVILNILIFSACNPNERIVDDSQQAGPKTLLGQSMEKAKDLSTLHEHRAEELDSQLD